MMMMMMMMMMREEEEEEDEDEKDEDDDDNQHGWPPMIFVFASHLGQGHASCHPVRPWLLQPTLKLPPRSTWRHQATFW